MNALKRTFYRLVCAVLCISVFFSLTSCGKAKDVKITLPALFLNEAEKKDLPGYCEVNGFISAELDEKKDKVTVTMSKSTHDVLLVRMGMQVMSSISKLIRSDTFPYFTEIGEYADDFSSVTVKVNGEKYKNDSTSSLLPMTVGESCLLYLEYTTAKKPKCTVTVADDKTGEILFKDEYDVAGK